MMSTMAGIFSVARGCTSTGRLASGFDDLVFDVGQVHHELDLEALPLEVAVQQIVENERAVVADVRRAVDSRAACVDTDALFEERLKILDLACQCVEEAKHVSVSLR